MPDTHIPHLSIGFGWDCAVYGSYRLGTCEGGQNVIHYVPTMFYSVRERVSRVYLSTGKVVPRARFPLFPPL